MRLRFELALGVGLVVALVCCRRGGVLPTVLVAGAAWLGASGFLLLEMQQLDVHALAGGGERWLSAGLLADAAAALGKAWIASVFGAALCLAALSTGGRAREVERLLASALLASLAVAAGYAGFAILALALAHRASATSGVAPRFELGAWIAPLAAVAALVAQAWGGLGLAFEDDLPRAPSSLLGAFGGWLVAWFAYEARAVSTAPLRHGAPGAPRFWRDVGLRLALLAVVLRLCEELCFQRVSAASFARREEAALLGPAFGIVGLALAWRAHLLRWRARDLSTWGRGTLGAAAALAPLALSSASGAGLRGAAVAGCVLAVQGALVHAALAVERREPHSEAPWWLGGGALAVALPLPPLLGAQARFAVFEHAESAGSWWLAALVGFECVAGSALGFLALLRLRRSAQRQGAAERALPAARWPLYAAAGLCGVAALCAALGPSIDARLRSGRLHGVSGAGSADDFLGRRYERSSVGSSRRASSSAVLRSVPALRQPTMSAQGI
ncbi:MAG: hypothetical protein IPN34_05160 [Planctomycetes bacterium]|nr:hypothetical protein [Planctomycetota bacterium]